MIYKIVAFVVKWGIHIICRIDAPDIDKIPLKGPVIGYANHSAMIEVPVFFGLLQPRRISGWAAKRSDHCHSCCRPSSKEKLYCMLSTSQRAPG